MRDRPSDQDLLFYTINVESRIRPDHPLRSLKRTIDAILNEMSPLLTAAYSKTGRPSVPPERLLKALMLLALYSIRRERQLVERIDTNLLFRWFLDMSPGDHVFDATEFTHNRPRLDEYGLTAAFFDAVLVKALQAGLCSDEHFSVDGSLIESYASIKSIRTKDVEAQQDADSNSFKPRNPEVDFHGQKRTNDTHASWTVPEAKLYRKGMGKKAKLSHMGHALAEKRNGLVMGVVMTETNGTAECEAALVLLDRLQARHARSPKTLGADKGNDSGPFYLDLEQRGVTPHCAVIGTSPPKTENVAPCRRLAVVARERMKARLTTVGYQLSQRSGKKVEEYFGWMKTVAGLGRSRWVGRWKLQQQLELTAAGYNLVRMRKLSASR
ncbi:IS5 family transposase [Planctomicrobium piriforme]|uniref:Transposase n=1 Tax=Planctomicrobium piriforme TaxID=1576369 RepID=A0A1I3DYT6_9PLAN|nr:IS5 family transposase [Planctomicrobium piriforme]SFH91897.1 Transposase [Planctomicrobium piriforme]